LPRSLGCLFGLLLLLTSWHFIRRSSSTARSASCAISQLRECIRNLSHTGRRVLVLYSAGSALAAGKKASDARNKQLGDIHAIALGQALRKEQEVLRHALCVGCQTNIATHHGHSCRCLCLCAGCVAAAGSRTFECPKCEEFTEFVRA